MIRIRISRAPVQICLTQVNQLQRLFFLLPHHRFVRLVHVVIAQQMQQTVHTQIHQFPVQAVTVLLALPHSRFRRNNNIPQQMRIRPAELLRFLRFIQRKGQHICRPVNAPIILVQYVNDLITHQ